MTDKQKPESSEIKPEHRANLDRIVLECGKHPERIALIAAIAALPETVFGPTISPLAVRSTIFTERRTDREALDALTQETRKYLHR